jgi:hypothetical protein
VTVIHASRGIRTRNPKKEAAAYAPLKPHGYDRRYVTVYIKKKTGNFSD